jgi:acetoin utilization deacetylase AcuC-like enzyme
MGFCLFNNVAVAAAHALHRGLERVLIVDFDVHHGNGTQDVFYADPRVLYVSSHAYPFYPGTGSLREVGEGPGRGYTVNLPLPDGTGDADLVLLYRELVAPIARAFAPQLVLISAGFDAHRGDPLAGMDLTAAGYSALTALCVCVADESARGRVVAALEGGYRLDAIAASAAAVTAALLGDESPAIAEEPSARARQMAEAYGAHLSPFWPTAFPG